MAIVQQSGIGLGIVGDGKGWSGGATRTDNEASQPQVLKEKRPKVFFDVSLADKKLGRIVLELFGDVVPKTVENFRCLCTGERGISPISGKPLHLKGSKFHKIIPGKLVQGGDFVNGNGTGGESIYNQDGDGCFPSENFKVKHDRPGLVSMAHRGHVEGKNCSQFLFTTKAYPKLDGKHVVFGRVIDGIDKVLKLESIGTQSGKPLFEAVISDCGELESEAMKSRKRKFGAVEDALPPGWEQKESRSKPGLFYYVHESGHTQFEKPSMRAKDPLSAKAELARQRREEAAAGVATKGPSEAEKLPERAVQKGEARIWHILKKHRDFFGKPATSWRQKEILWSKQEAKTALLKLREKLVNVGIGGGTQALLRKFENYARQESDDDVSAKVGGDLGPVTKKRRLFGTTEIAKVAFELKIGDISGVIETNEGCHLVARFE